MYFLRIENDGKFHELLKIDEYEGLLLLLLVYVNIGISSVE